MKERKEGRMGETRGAPIDEGEGMKEGKGGRRREEGGGKIN
jgi:hypothetical protein